MIPSCAHDEKDLRCIDSRLRNGWTYRRYICKCGMRFTTAEIQMNGPQQKGERAQFYKAELADRLTHQQCRNLLEQIDAGHTTLNLI